MSNNIIRDVVTRTSGEMYLGVVGPVRCGKSTFIRKFMELKVLPHLTDDIMYAKVQDELPQSGEGKTIMTVEPKFIPSTNMKVTFDEDVSVSVRLVDCVGYIIPNAKGYLNEDGTNRVVQTPWFAEPIPFGDAAEIGTKKVIDSHSNIGIVMSSDGSFGEFTRPEYEQVEELVIDELKKLDKPFIVVINTTNPHGESTKRLVENLKEKYGVTVIAVDVKNMTSHDVDHILKSALDEFDIAELNIQVPNWVNVLDDDVEYKHNFNELVNVTTGNFRKMRDAFHIQDSLKESGLFLEVNITDIDSATGLVSLEVVCDDTLYNEIIEEIIGEKIGDKGEFISILQELKKAKNIYNRIGKGFERVEQVGYNIAIPTINEMVLETPELLKQGGRYGLKLKAKAPATLLVKLDVESTFEPIIGSEDQAQALIDHMLEDCKTNPEKLWNSEIFGRKLCDVILDGINGKVANVPETVLDKFKVSMEKVVNHGKGGVVAIIF